MDQLQPQNSNGALESWAEISISSYGHSFAVSSPAVSNLSSRRWHKSSSLSSDWKIMLDKWKINICTEDWKTKC